MVDEIINKYEGFSDATINEFNFKYGTSMELDKKGSIEVTLLCMNSQEDYQFEYIKLIFKRVLQFRYIERKRYSSAVIETALIIPTESYILIDFFPIIEGDGTLTVNESSKFLIESETISYEFIKKYGD